MNIQTKTKRVFDTDAYIKEYDATVISCVRSEKEGFEGLFETVTDATIFSPEGGGQKSDVGFFDDIEVADVREEGEEIIHFLKSGVKPGETVTQKIDFDLRFRRMQNHNAEHLICGLIHARFGYDNVGFHLSEIIDENGNLRIEAIMDVDGPIESEALKEIEIEANKAIAKNVPIYALLPSCEEAEKINFRSKLDIRENLRLVVIEGFDVCACCAPCLRSSSEIQLVKILDSMPHRGGMRLTLIAGLDAIGDYIFLHDENRQIMKMLSSERNNTAESVSNMLEKASASHEETVLLKKQITNLFTEKLVSRLKSDDKKINVFFAPSLDEVQSRNLINETAAGSMAVIAVMFAKNEGTYRFVIGKDENLKDISLNAIAKKMREELSARGGGSEQMVQGSVSAAEEDIVSFFDKLN